MDTTPPQKHACASLAQQLFELYLVPTDTGRIELIDWLLDDAGIHDSKDRDKALLLCDKAHLKLEARRKDLARLLLRCSITSLEEAEKQMRLTFG
jgi:hypothetical protein